MTDYKRQQKIYITKEEIKKFTNKYSVYDNKDTYDYIDGGCSIHEWLEKIVYKKCPDNRKLLENITTGKIDNIIRKFKRIFGHLNYKYDMLSLLLTKKIAKLEGKSYYQLYEISHHLKDIKININNIPKIRKWERQIEINNFNNIFMEIYKNIKIHCKKFTKTDIYNVMKLTRKQFIKKLNNHPYIRNKK